MSRSQFSFGQCGTHTCTHTPFPQTRASVLQLCHVFRLPGSTAFFLHTLVLRLIRMPGQLSWVTVCAIRNCAHRIISATSFLPQGWGESGTSCAPLSPLLRQTPQFYWRKCFLLTTILSFNLYPLSFFLVFLNLEENLSLISLSPFVTSVSPQYNPDPNGGAEEGYGKPFERNRSA